jgi:hypothetical protein
MALAIMSPVSQNSLLGSIGLLAKTGLSQDMQSGQAESLPQTRLE